MFVLFVLIVRMMTAVQEYPTLVDRVGLTTNSIGWLRCSVIYVIGPGVYVVLVVIPT
jgi:hypothetical protein